MAYTGNAWDEDKPANTRAISLGDDDIREVKAQIGEFFDREHSLDRNTGGEAGSDSLANNGQHRVGVTGVLAVDTTSNLDTAGNYNDSAGSGDDKVTGAIAFDTDLRVQTRYSGSAWVPMAPYVAAYDSESTAVTVSSGTGSWTLYNATNFGSSGVFTVNNLLANQLVVISASIKVSRLTVAVGLKSGSARIVEDPSGTPVIVGSDAVIFSGGTLQLTRSFLVTGTSHAFGIQVQHDSGVNETAQEADTVITVYPGDYS